MESITIKKTTAIGISCNIQLVDIVKVLGIPRTIVVSDDLYESAKEFYKDYKYITIMCASELFKEQELIKDYKANLLEPKVFNPRDSFEHIRKRNDKRIFRVK